SPRAGRARSSRIRKVLHPLDRPRCRLRRYRPQCTTAAAFEFGRCAGRGHGLQRGACHLHQGGWRLAPLWHGGGDLRGARAPDLIPAQCRAAHLERPHRRDGEERMSTSSIPAGWHHNPSAWASRLTAAVVALIGCAIATYLTLYQVDVIHHVWEPFFGSG